MSGERGRGGREAGAPKGTYRAKVKKKVIKKSNGNRIVCKRAKSNTVTVS